MSCVYLSRTFSYSTSEFEVIICCCYIGDYMILWGNPLRRRRGERNSLAIFAEINEHHSLPFLLTFYFPKNAQNRRGANKCANQVKSTQVVNFVWKYCYCKLYHYYIADYNYCPQSFSNLPYIVHKNSPSFVLSLLKWDQHRNKKPVWRYRQLQVH